MGYGLVLLRLSPVMLTSAAVQFDYSQYLFFRPYTELPAVQDRATVNETLQHYVHREFPRGFGCILALYPLTWAATAAIVTVGNGVGARRGLPLAAGAAAARLSPISRGLYMAGAVLSVGHMAFGPRALGLMETIGALRPDAADSGKKVATAGQDDNVGLLQTWLQLHVFRSLAVDVPSWLCFTAAFLLSRPFR